MDLAAGSIGTFPFFISHYTCVFLSQYYYIFIDQTNIVMMRLPHKLYRSYVLYKAKLYRYRLRSSEATFFGESYPEKNWYYSYYDTKRSHLRSLSSRSDAPKKSPHKGICDKNCGLTRFIKTSNGRRKLVQLHNLAVMYCSVHRRY